MSNMKGDNSGIVQDKDLREISKDIGRDGEFLGRSLGLQDKEIVLIREDNLRNCREKNYQILKKWIDQKSCEATYKKLTEAFLEMDNKTMAEKYSKRQPVKEETAKKKQQRKRPSGSKTTGPAPKRQKKTSTNSTSIKDQTTKKEPAKKQRKRPSLSVKKTGRPEKQNKSPASSKHLNSAKGNVGRPNTGQKSSTSSNSPLKIIHQEERGYPKQKPGTGTWYRGKFIVANESNWFFVTIWGNQEKEKMSLFKKGHCVVLKSVTTKGNDITFGLNSKVEKHGTPIIVGEDVLRKIEKQEKKSYQTLEEIKKSGSSKGLKTKLRICKVEECQTIKKTEDGKKIVLKNLIVRNHKKSKKNPGEVPLTVFGPDARRTKKGQTIVLNVWYNTTRQTFENKGNYIMKIIPKSKKGKSKKRKQKSK